MRTLVNSSSNQTEVSHMGSGRKKTDLLSSYGSVQSTENWGAYGQILSWSSSLVHTETSSCNPAGITQTIHITSRFDSNPVGHHHRHVWVHIYTDHLQKRYLVTCVSDYRKRGQYGWNALFWWCSCTVWCKQHDGLYDSGLKLLHKGCLSTVILVACDTGEWIDLIKNIHKAYEGCLGQLQDNVSQYSTSGQHLRSHSLKQRDRTDTWARSSSRCAHRTQSSYSWWSPAGRQKNVDIQANTSN